MAAEGRNKFNGNRSHLRFLSLYHTALGRTRS